MVTWFHFVLSEVKVALHRYLDTGQNDIYAFDFVEVKMLLSLATLKGTLLPDDLGLFLVNSFSRYFHNLFILCNEMER